MSQKLDRAGVFMAKPMSWAVKTYDSQAVAVEFEFKIRGQWNGEGWDSWRDYDEYTVWGLFFVVKKDGSVNSTTVEQLARSLGWDGDLNAVVNQEVPGRAVQITVKEDIYKDTVRFKAGWMNHKDFVPTSQGADPETVSGLNNRFGSLLRAAAASAKKDQPAPKVAPTEAPLVDDDLPF